MKKIILVLLLATNAAAEQAVQPCAYIGTLYSLISADSTASSLAREGDTCTIEWTSKEGKEATNTNRAAFLQSLIDELAALEIKLDDGTATLANLRRWAKIKMKLDGSAKRP